MSDTCIVCLGLLDPSVAEPSDTLNRDPTADLPHAAPLSTEVQTLLDGNINGATHPINTTALELIAHLRPCGHDLHNECLKPWVERANSCPICRANFHLVELMHHVGGPVLSSYTVQDKTQVADVDPSLFLEIPDEDEDDGSCQRCGESDNEDILMYCDGCEKLWHTYCVGVDDVPLLSWFCESCAAERATDPQLRYSRRTRGVVGRRRTRGMERRRRNHSVTHDDGWNQVWQSVWSNLSLDLDFPFDDDDSPATMMRRHRQAVETNRREHEAWERRMRVAELAGAGNRFRQNVSTILDDAAASNERRTGTQAHETEEEIAAWEAFNEARVEPAEPESSSAHRSKRKSRGSSPAQIRQLSNSPEREVKRRRTSIPPPPAAPPPPPQSQLRSRPLRAPSSSRATASAQARPRTVLDSAAPSFLQSLLQEVEDSAGPSHLQMHRPSPRNPGSPSAEQQSPRPSSPATSNPSSPRAMSATPPPLPNGYRPSSPPGLSSSIQPVFPPASFSPRSPTLEGKDKLQEPPPARESAPRVPPAPNIARPKPRRPRIPDAALTARPRSNDTSPTRLTLSVDKKADVQRLVSAALKPHYHEQKISKDEYTTINRDVSRMLYEKIGDFEALDLEGKAKWEKVAGEEVNKAVTALRI